MPAACSGLTWLLIRNSVTARSGVWRFGGTSSGKNALSPENPPEKELPVMALVEGVHVELHPHQSVAPGIVPHFPGSGVQARDALEGAHPEPSQAVHGHALDAVVRQAVALQVTLEPACRRIKRLSPLSVPTHNTPDGSSMIGVTRSLERLSGFLGSCLQLVNVPLHGRKRFNPALVPIHRAPSLAWVMKRTLSWLRLDGSLVSLP